MLVNYLFVLCLFCMYYFLFSKRTKKVSCFLCSLSFWRISEQKLCACEKRDSLVYSFVFFWHKIRSGVPTGASVGWKPTNVVTQVAHFFHSYITTLGQRRRKFWKFGGARSNFETIWYLMEQVFLIRNLLTSERAIALLPLPSSTVPVGVWSHVNKT